ncbi:ABC transporter permease [Gemella cuniculi]|uniref:ABC transporter permease n=1 Tax=Gemella cuniculi TaxID=150240 RepID=UPI000400D631|nr:iron ABC transporter permease [Gemella cuniculi]
MKFKKTGLIDKILILTIIVSFFIFILYPFIAAFNYGRQGDLLTIFYESKGYYYKLLGNSLKVSVGTTILTVMFSVFVALYYFISEGKFKKIILLIFMVAMISPPFVTSLSYINLFGRRGLITYGILGLNFNPYGYIGIISMQSVMHVAINALLLIGFMNGIDKSMVNSARSLGADTNRVILDILLPIMKPAIKVVALLTFIRSMADFSTPAIVGGKYNVLATEGYLAFISEGNLPKAVILNFIILIPSIIIFLLYSKNFRNISMENKGLISVNLSMANKGIIYYISFIMTLLVVFILIFLYGAIILSAFTTMEYGKLVFTLENFILANEHVSGVFIRTIIYSLIAGIVSSILGYLLQYYIYIREIKFLKAFDFIATLPYILPGTFFGLGYVLAFNSYPMKITGTALIVILNLIFKQLPFASKLGYSSISQISHSQLKSVRDLGGGRFYEIKDLVFPSSRKGLYISFINGFTSTMTTIGSIIFLVYPSQKVATLVMFDVIESGKYDIGSVIAFYIIMICLIVNAVYYLTIGKKR